MSKLKEAQVSTAFREKIEEMLAGRDDGGCGKKSMWKNDGTAATQTDLVVEYGGMMRLQRSLRRNDVYIRSTKSQRKCQINW